VYVEENDFFSLTHRFDSENENDTIISQLVWIKKQKEYYVYRPLIEWILNQLKERNQHLREVIDQLTESSDSLIQMKKQTSSTTTTTPAAIKPIVLFQFHNSFVCFISF
jgi:hypothetical protein